MLALGYYATEAYFLVIGDTLGVSKDETTRAVYRVSKALCAMVRGLLLFPTSDLKGVFLNVAGTNKRKNYPHTFVQHCMRRSQTN